MSVYIRLLRCHQWLKNLFVFAPAFFANKLFSASAIISTVLAFIAFSLVSSSIYIFNDIKDADSDRFHPIKCKRPIASGEIMTPAAVIIAVCCAGLGFSVAYYIDLKCVLVLLSYVLINTAYTLYLKRISIVDIMIISTGFILRLYMGSSAINIALSEWIIVMTFLLAMFLALAKRRDDCIITGNISGFNAKDLRKSISGYSFQFIDISLSIMSSVLIVAYLIYCISPDVIARLGNHVYLTFIFVVAGVLRYLQITLVLNNSGSPSLVLIKDRMIQLIIALWLITFGTILLL